MAWDTRDRKTMMEPAPSSHPFATAGVAAAAGAPSTSHQGGVHHDDAEDARLLAQQQPRTAAAAARRHPNVVKRPTRGPIQKPADYSSLLCGLAAGVVQAGVFNPYDRALYLSIKEARPFLSRDNWRQPYTGFLQSLGGRALAGGLYFPCEHFYLHAISASESRPASNLAAGILSGATLAVLMNPLTAVRYKTWGRAESRGVLREARGMLVRSGYSARPFLNGLAATVCRDAVFGGCYTPLRLQLQWALDLDPHRQWAANFVAAGLATVASGPWNYARTVQYATRSQERQPTIRQVFRELWGEVRRQPTLPERLHFLQHRLRVGWGTLRVAMGLAFAHSVYDALQEVFNKNRSVLSS